MNGRNVMTWCLLAAIVALGAFVRLYRISEQSVWWDDYNSIAYLSAPSLSEYLHSVTATNEMHVPLYFVAQYFWGKCIGTSPVQVRLLTVGAGLAAILLVCWLGTQVSGYTTGLTAALLLAVSPMHLFHDQSIRPYAFVVLFALISLGSFLKAFDRDEPGWWVLNFFANLLLVETHLYGILLVFSEGVCLLILSPERFRRVLLWSLAHMAIVLPLVFGIHKASGIISGWYNDMCRAPTLGALLVDLFGDDAVALNNEILPSGETWPFVPTKLAVLLNSSHWLFDGILLCLFCACFVASIWRARLHWPFSHQPNDAEPRHSRQIMILACVVVLPVLVLSVASHVWRPTTFPRYTIFATPALYVLAGDSLGQLRSRAVRRGAALLLAGAYAYQLSWILPASTRTQWNDAIRVIESQKANDGVLLVASDAGVAASALAIYCFNARPAFIPAWPADSFELAASASRRFLSARKTNEESCTAWLLIHRKYSDAALPELDRALAAGGMAFDAHTFPAMRKLTLYKIRLRSDAAASNGSDGTQIASRMTQPEYQALVLTELCRSLTNCTMRQAYRHDTGASSLLQSMASLDDDLTARILLTAQAAPEMNRPLVRDLASILFQRDLSGINRDALHNRI